MKGEAMDVILEVAGWIVTAAFGLIAYLFKKNDDRLEKLGKGQRALDQKLDDHRLHVAQNYAAKSVIREMRDEVVASLHRIEDKLDRKADKP